MNDYIHISHKQSNRELKGARVCVFALCCVSMCILCHINNGKLTYTVHVNKGTLSCSKSNCTFVYMECRHMGTHFKFSISKEKFMYA